jgi:hypothetical protein
MPTNQESKHTSVRAVTGTTWTYNGDWHALFDSASIASGTFNERMIAWINGRLSSSYTNINDAMQAFAVNQGFNDWDSMGTFTTSGGGGSSFPPSSLVFWFSGDNVLNTTETISENFAPAAVNTGTDKITLTTTGYGRTSTQDYGRCTFTTTGTLPAGLSLATYYIPENNNDGTFSFYPIATDANWADFAGYENGETIVPGLYYVLQRGKINITSQGTGTHTINFVTTVRDVYDNILGANLFTKSQRNGRFEILSDAKGQYIALPGATGLAGGYQDAEGKLMTDTISSAQIGTFFDNKRYIYSVAVNRPKSSMFLSKQRAILVPSNVTTGTGVFTLTGSGLTTGRAVTRDVLSDGGAFPTPNVAFANPVYVRVSGSSITLHPTAIDATTNNLLAYTYSDAGAGIFAITENVSVKSGAGTRKTLIDINKQSNDHTFSPLMMDFADFIDMSSSSEILTGGNDGRLSGVFVNYSVPSTTIFTVKIFIPSGATGPTCRDTTTALTSGTYYLTYEPTNFAQVRLHRTLANAQASAGITTASLSNTDCIKYSALGSGSCGIYVASNLFGGRQFDDGFTSYSTFVGLNQYEEFGAYVSLVDYNDGSGKQKFSAGINLPSNRLSNATSSYDSPQNASSAFSSVTLGNAGQPHISGHADLYEMFVGASNTDPTADITAIINQMKTKYSIVATPPVNSVAPVVSGTATRGQVLSCTTGTWSLSPLSYAYQWYRSPSTAISGATSSTYTLAAGDVGLQIFCRVTATNIYGTSSPTDSNTTAAVADAAFTPAEVANIALWLDASDTATITHSSGAVSQWNDKSGNTRHATQGTAANQFTTNASTINSLNVFTFADAVRKMEVPTAAFSAASNTIFIVMEVTGGSGNRSFISNLDNTLFLPMAQSGSANAEVYRDVSVGTYYVNGVVKTPTTRGGAFTDMATGANAIHVFKNTDIDVGENNGATRTIGNGFSSFGLAGRLAEVISYSRDLTTSEINQVANYLETKWAATWTDI